MGGVENGFTIRVDYDAQRCIYDVANVGSGTPIYEDLSEETWACLSIPSQSEAMEKSGFSYLTNYGRYALTCYAIGTNKIGVIGDLRPPITESNYDLTITTKDGSDTESISSTAQKSAVFGDFAYAELSGSLVTASDCEREALDEDNYVPVYRNGNWILSSSTAYNNYVIEVRSLSSGSPNSREEYIRVTNLASNKVLAGTSYDGFFENRYNKYSSQVVAELDSPVQLPLTKLYIKASTLGIVQLESKAKIVSATSSQFKSGDEGYIQATIENIGNNEGYFNVFATCQSPFQSTDSKTINLDAGESDTVYIRIVGTSEDEENGACVVNVETMGTTVTKTISVSMTPIITCTAGKTFCGIENGLDVVEQCNSVGSSSSIIERCSSNEICDNSECVVGSVKKCRAFCKLGNFFTDLFRGVLDFFTLLKYLITILVSIFVLIFSKDLLKNMEAFEDNNVIQWVVSGVVTLMVALFLISFLFAPIFWIASVIVGVILLFGNRIKDFFGGLR